MKKNREIYYSDLLNDDFAGTNIKQTKMSPNFKYVHKNPIWRFFSGMVFYVVAVPIIWVACLFLGIKVVGKKNLKSLRHKGFFLYGNHTQIADAFAPQVKVLAPKRGMIMANPDAISIRGIRGLVMMLGCIPVPNEAANKDAFKEAIKYFYAKRRAIIVYPEKHIWPYYTRIRPFPDDSFIYPAELLSPVVAMCTTYRHNRLFKNGKPKPVIHVSRPFYADENMSIPERKKYLRGLVYDFMIQHSAEDENVEWIKYIKKDVSVSLEEKGIENHN
ncbi:MAG: 1-acyl-sn-glycerol-3-phosphate acyltransferase [Bacilli bacterium]|nr:1-acyl-sn-glycerol-3-phosphate acyltransferase [Bacilli bacterium]